MSYENLCVHWKIQSKVEVIISIGIIDCSMVIFDVFSRKGNRQKSAMSIAQSISIYKKNMNSCKQICIRKLPNILLGSSFSRNRLVFFTVLCRLKYWHNTIFDYIIVSQFSDVQMSYSIKWWNANTHVIKLYINQVTDIIIQFDRLQNVISKTNIFHTETLNNDYTKIFRNEPSNFTEFRSWKDNNSFASTLFI